jgi:hypothetical protein
VRCLRLLLLLGLIWQSVVPASAAGGKAARWEQWDREAAAFFAGPIQRFEVTLGRRELDNLRDNPRDSQPATVKVGTNVFEKVAVHVKGSAGSTRSIDDNPALTLNFDKLKPGQRCFGLSKLSLNNSVQDSSYLDENVASWLYLSAGVPTARASHALMTLNGRFLGLYVLKEGYDGEFIRRNFTGGTNAAGNLYDGGFVQDITSNLERDAGKGVTNWSDLARLRTTLRLPAEQKRAELEKVLDVDRFLTYVAFQMFTADWDGYIRNRNNYRLYLDPSGRGTFIPHGMDQLFRRTEDQVRDGWSSFVPNRVFDLPEIRDRLRKRMTELAATSFQVQPITNQIAGIRERIRQAMVGLPVSEWRYVDGEIRQKRRMILERIAFVQDELQNWPEPMKPLAAGTAVKLGEWEQVQQSGRAKFDRQPRQESDPISLHLAAVDGDVIASYRAPTGKLPSGLYRLTARAATRNVQAYTGNLGAGVGIRISGAQRTHKLEGTADWTLLTFDFELGGDEETTVILELRATKGDVWFDLGSVKLVRR